MSSQIKDVEVSRFVVSCFSNDATNSVCGSTHVSFPTKGMIRGDSFAMKLSHVEYLAKLYDGGILEQILESVSLYNRQLLGRKDNTKMLRNRSLLYIDAGQRALQRVGLLDEQDNLLNADQTPPDDSYDEFRSLFRGFNNLTHEEKVEFNEMFKVLLKDTLKIRV